jgi:hypothetical protein
VSIHGDAPECGQWEVFVDVQREHPEHVSINVSSDKDAWVLMDTEEVGEFIDALTAARGKALRAKAQLDKIFPKEAE